MTGCIWCFVIMLQYMAKAMREASLTSLGCFAHTLQLVVHDGVLSL